MDCPTCYVNGTPEVVAVSNTNLTVAVSLGDDSVKWVDLPFVRADSTGGLGLIFVLEDIAEGESYEVADVNELHVFIGNISQPPSSYSIAGDGTYVTLNEALPVGYNLRVKALVRVVEV